ncbi:hypothetical protein [Actinocorallia libanotica]|uniref:Uncharacterized protein n=1 Tax=Actinocorallia libanotica TaxID=46162 RepID=A0ABN1Q1J9_9ACTN
MSEYELGLMDHHPSEQRFGVFLRDVPSCSCGPNCWCGYVTRVWAVDEADACVRAARHLSGDDGLTVRHYTADQLRAEPGRW